MQPGHENTFYETMRENKVKRKKISFKMNSKALTYPFKYELFPLS